MRPGNKILVMRWAPMIGRPASERRVSVYHRAGNLAGAIDTALYAQRRDISQGIRSGYWIVLAGQKQRMRSVLLQLGQG